MCDTGGTKLSFAVAGSIGLLAILGAALELGGRARLPVLRRFAQHA
jgi:hypothetical protein